MYPLVRELAADAMPVTVTCRVLKLARQPYYRWLRAPGHRRGGIRGLSRERLFDAHRDDPEFGYRFLVDEARDAGQPMAERTAWTPTVRAGVKARRAGVSVGGLGLS